MSKPRTIHTIKSLLARATEVGDCYEWNDYLRNNTPAVWHEGRVMAVRRVMWEILGKTVPVKHFLTTRCGNYKCVNPDHIIAQHPKMHAKKMAQAVDYSCLLRLQRITEKAQARRKLTDEQIQIILNDPRNCRELGEVFNVNKSLVSRIRRGQAYRMHVAKNNPFFQLYG